MPTLLLLLLTASRPLADCYCFPVLPTAAYLLAALAAAYLLAALAAAYPLAAAAPPSCCHCCSCCCYLHHIIIITHLRLEQYFWIYDVLVKIMTACQSKYYLSKSRLLVRGHFVRSKATCQWLPAQVMAAVNDCLSVAVHDCLSVAVNCCQ
jgi:hypothetical protein